MKFIGGPRQAENVIGQFATGSGGARGHVHRSEAAAFFQSSDFFSLETRWERGSIHFHRTGRKVRPTCIPGLTKKPFVFVLMRWVVLTPPF